MVIYDEKKVGRAGGEILSKRGRKQSHGTQRGVLLKEQRVRGRDGAKKKGIQEGMWKNRQGRREGGLDAFHGGVEKKTKRVKGGIGVGVLESSFRPMQKPKGKKRKNFERKCLPPKGEKTTRSQ